MFRKQISPFINFALVDTDRSKTDIISSATGYTSAIFVSIFHKRLFIRTNPERKKQLV
jgi:hypothetical protein